MNLKTIIEKLVKLIDPTDDIINVTNIAMLNDGDEFVESKSAIILSIVNIEEDKTLKNQSTYQRETRTANEMLAFRHPTQHLIISLLFSSYNKDLSKYMEGVEKLRNVISYFQQNNSFYYKDDNTELIEYSTFATKTEAQQLHYAKITFESVSQSMDQLNQMWSCLGSRYMPSMLYKMRLYSIQGANTLTHKIVLKGAVKLWENDKDDPVGIVETQGFKLNE
ncbi:Pvc16 family protein [Flavobacterium sp.]|uniref:Pvc16 family protein n=1 Tax=Flavobacterium sp. TaxID=239 RepID=UPI00286BA696|nr:Pvc16 family protein [Flavobacterium sp.]